METRWPSLDRRDISIARLHARGVFTDFASGPYSSSSPLLLKIVCTCTLVERTLGTRDDDSGVVRADQQCRASRSEPIRKIETRDRRVSLSLSRLRSCLARAAGITGITVAAPTLSQRKAFVAAYAFPPRFCSTFKRRAQVYVHCLAQLLRSPPAIALDRPARRGFILPLLHS